MKSFGSFDFLNPPAWVSPRGRKRMAELVGELEALRAKALGERPPQADAGDRPCQLKALQAALDPRTPIPQHADALPQVLAGLKALNAAEKVIDAAKEEAPGEKAFRSLQARVALVGMQLLRTDARDGTPRLFVVNGLKAMEIRNLDDLEGLIAYMQRER